MGFKSKTYSLSDEVVAAIEHAREVKGLSPNRYLRLLMGIETDTVGVGVEQSPYARPAEGVKDVPDIRSTPITYPDDPYQRLPRRGAGSGTPRRLRPQREKDDGKR